MLINLYCDESCHLNYGNDEVMGFAGIEAPYEKIKEINENLKEIKSDFKISPYQELKWSKVSNSNVELYKKFISCFFIDDDLNFRATLIKNKSQLKFTKRNTKSDFYYKMLYFMIVKRLQPQNVYNIYLDIKDTNSAKRIKTLELYLNRTKLDYDVTNAINKVQTIRSYESNILQLTDILLGAIVYYNNGNHNSKSKNILVNYIKEKSKKSLIKSTLANESKFNIFISDAKKMKLRGEDEL